MNLRPMACCDEEEVTPCPQEGCDESPICLIATFDVPFSNASNKCCQCEDIVNPIELLCINRDGQQYQNLRAPFFSYRANGLQTLQDRCAKCVNFRRAYTGNDDDDFWVEVEYVYPIFEDPTQQTYTLRYSAPKPDSWGTCAFYDEDHVLTLVEPTGDEPTDDWRLPCLCNIPHSMTLSVGANCSDATNDEDCTKPHDDEPNCWSCKANQYGRHGVFTANLPALRSGGTCEFNCDEPRQIHMANNGVGDFYDAIFLVIGCPARGQAENVIIELDLENEVITFTRARNLQVIATYSWNAPPCIDDDYIAVETATLVSATPPIDTICPWNFPASFTVTVRHEFDPVIFTDVPRTLAPEPCNYECGVYGTTPQEITLGLLPIMSDKTDQPDDGGDPYTCEQLDNCDPDNSPSAPLQEHPALYDVTVAIPSFGTASRPASVCDCGDPGNVTLRFGNWGWRDVQKSLVPPAPITGSLDGMESNGIDIDTPIECSCSDGYLGREQQSGVIYGRWVLYYQNRDRYDGGFADGAMVLEYRTSEWNRAPETTRDVVRATWHSPAGQNWHPCNSASNQLTLISSDLDLCEGWTWPATVTVEWANASAYLPCAPPGDVVLARRDTRTDWTTGSDTPACEWSYNDPNQQWTGDPDQSLAVCDSWDTYNVTFSARDGLTYAQVELKSHYSILLSAVTCEIEIEIGPAAGSSACGWAVVIPPSPFSVEFILPDLTGRVSSVRNYRCILGGGTGSLEW